MTLLISGRVVIYHNFIVGIMHYFVWYFLVLYDSVSQGMGTTKLAHLIGWNGNWPRSRFSHLDRHLDRQCFEVISSSNIYFCKCQKNYEKKSKESKVNSAHRRSEAKCQLVQTSYIKQMRSVCTYDLCRDSPIQTSCSVSKLANLFYVKLYVR